MKKAFALSIIAAALIGSNGLALAGDAAAGKAKASACGGCHGANGIASNPMYPNLAGQNEKYFVKALKEYKSGTRKDATMSAFVGSLSDADMENLAAYYKSLK